MERWTEALAEDLLALAKLAALTPITPEAYAVAGYPSEEDAFQAHVDQTEGPMDDGIDVNEEPCFCDTCVNYRRRHSDSEDARWYQSWPALKASIVGFLRTWPLHAPLLPS